MRRIILGCCIGVVVGALGAWLVLDVEPFWGTSTDDVERAVYRHDGRGDENVTCTPRRFDEGAWTCTAGDECSGRVRRYSATTSGSGVAIKNRGTIETTIERMEVCEAVEAAGG